MAKLTKRTIDAAQADVERDYFIWDDDMPGFGLRVLKSGKKTYQIQYRKGGRTRRNSIGMHGTITPDEARKIAKEKLGRVAKGDNPAEERAIHRGASSVADVCERFMNEYVPAHCKETTAKEYRRSVDMFIKPVIGTRKVPDIIRTDIAKLHHDLRDKPYQANRTLGVLSVIFNQCEIWGLRPDGSNPCRHVKKYTEIKRERFLSEDELKRLWETLDECERDGSESAAACNAYRLLILTGCRLGEIQTLKWDYIKEDGIYLPNSKTGAKKVYIGQAVHDTLAKIKRIEDNPYVIPGTVEGQHLTDFQRPWRRVRNKAGLEDLRIHDLRHSFASFGLASGLSLAEIGKLLGHSQVQTTARYAHLAEKAAQRAADLTTNKIAISMDSS
ncbi:tyrosine-type recombinase/integrase [Pseudomonadota bacterium]